MKATIVDVPEVKTEPPVTLPFLWACTRSNVLWLRTLCGEYDICVMPNVVLYHSPTVKLTKSQFPRDSVRPGEVTKACTQLSQAWRLRLPPSIAIAMSNDA